MGKLIFWAIIGAFFYIVVWPNLGGAKTEALAARTASELEQLLKDTRDYYKLRGHMTTIKDMTWVRNYDDFSAGFEVDKTINYGPYLKGVFKPCISMTFREKKGKAYIELRDLENSEKVCQEFVKRVEYTKLNGRYDL